MQSGQSMKIYHYCSILFLLLILNGCEDANRSTLSMESLPTVSAVSPEASETDVYVHNNITVTFNKAMSDAEITSSRSSIISLKDSSGDSIEVTITASANQTEFTLDPSNDLDYNAGYSVTVSTNAQDLSGYSLDQDFSWNFTTIPYTAVYSSTNLSDHSVSAECNPGGTTSCACSTADVSMDSFTDYGQVTSNPREINTWVNAIGGKSFTETLPNGESVLLGTYRYQYKVKLPVLPATDVNQKENSGAVHMVMFLWDGRNALWQADKNSLEAGLYWELNPWNEDYGVIKVYDTDINTQTSTGITVIPDTEWHTFELVADFVNKRYVSIKIDGQSRDISSISTIQVERPTWGDEVSFLITEESLSTYPGEDCSYVFVWRTHFKDLEFGYLGTQ